MQSTVVIWFVVGRAGLGGGVMSLIHIPFTPSPATSLVQV